MTRRTHGGRGKAAGRRSGARLVVGLTGGIGTGKSTALDVLARMGARTVSCDELARRLSRPGGPVHRAVGRAFGRRFFDGLGRLDRRTLAGAAFRSPALRRRLEAAAHPSILRELRLRLARMRGPVAVADVPLLFEAGLAGEFDLTMVVAARPASALRRAAGRGLMTRADAARRMRAQWPLRRKAAMADVVVDNDGTRASLERRLAGWWRAFGLMARQRRAAR